MQNLIFDTPVLEPVSPATWRLRYCWTLIYKGEYYSIPAGFDTDGASIPRALWTICGDPMSIPRLYAAIVHDYLYSGGDPDATRKDADTLYRDLQIALGISKAKAYTEYYALRIFGRSHWQPTPPQITH